MSEQSGQNHEEHTWLALRPGNILRQSSGCTMGLDRCRLWALVLESRGVPQLIARDEHYWQILVPAEELSRAEEEIRIFEEKNRHWPPRAPRDALRDNLLVTLSVLLFLGIFHNLRLLEDGGGLFGIAPETWLDAGALQVQKVLEGQWWRVVTALSLHNGWLHLMANLAAGAVFIGRLCQKSGSGPGWTMVLAAGALGNFFNALLQPATHSAVGASTAIFGAVGILGAQGLFPRAQRRGLRRLLPMAGALGLLAFLGASGENTDIGAHLWGFAAGTLIGLISARTPARDIPITARGNVILGATTLLFFLFCWWLALAPA